MPPSKKKAALLKARKLIHELFDRVSCMPICVRLAWHDAGTFDMNAKGGFPEQGGAIGSIVSEHEFSQGCNNGLREGWEKYLKPIYQKVGEDNISKADLIQLASAEAISYCGGPKIPMRYGRIDGQPKKKVDNLGLPDGYPDENSGGGKDPVNHLKWVFNKYGMDDVDIVALSGAHTIGRAFKHRSGATDKKDTPLTKNGCPFLGNSKTVGGQSWTEDWLKFDNSYFTKMGNSDDQLVLATDDAIRKHPDFKPHFERFAKSQSNFFKEYANSHKKLSELGCRWSEIIYLD